ncbi:MAG TPA: LemA family protein [Candidatus Dojkabacteria bacterium]|nr:LemA family protein [Candidatus Dojkabacteria bacterium]HNW23531.1 LemA family protein [Candidatus Dojkabacteria bacterium]
MTFAYILIGVVAILVLYIISLNNTLVKMKLTVNEAVADIETFLKQRYDMIPNLVETVKGYAKHEKGIFESVSELRSKAMSAGSVEEKIKLEGELQKGISKIFAIAESYPELKANENFLNLQANLKDMEDEIQKSRRFYNGTVRDFNTKIQVFPNNIIVGILGFKEFPFFEAEEEEKKNVEVKF